METCALINSKKFQALKEMSGISSSSFDLFILSFYDVNGRFPELDEIPNANSRLHLINTLKIKGDDLKYTSIDHILNTIGANDISLAVQKINNIYRDLETEIVPLDKNAIIEITRRPSEYWVDNSFNPEIDRTEVTREKSKGVIVTMLQKLAKLYGINFHLVNTDILNRDFKDIVTDSHLASAFVYNGEIYINTDIAKIDAPIHELMHIFLGGMRFLNPILYLSIVESITNLPNYKLLSSHFKNRTLMDINEEIFVEEFSKYLTNQKSFIPDLGLKAINEIFYNITRIMDSSFMGKYSVKSVNPSELYNMSINSLSQLLGSTITTALYLGSLDDAGTHRQLANIKEEMLKNNDLILKCD